MMFRYIFTFFLVVVACSLEAITWQTNYDEAIREAKTSSKTVVLFFTGSDWCGWCNKLEQEALDTPEFQKNAGESFIFVKLDYPMKTKQDSTLQSQNQRLRDHFQVKSYPTVIVLDNNGEAIGLTGYRPGGGKQYASHLKKMVSDYTSYQSKIRSK